MRAKLLPVLLPLILLAGIAAAQPNVWHVVNGQLFGPGFTSSGPILNGDGSASAPSYSFAGDTDTGIWRAGSDQIRVALGGNDAFVFTTSGAQTISTNGTLFFGTAADVSVSRGAANRLDLATGDSLNMVGGGSAFQMATVPIISSAAPTVTSAGTSPSVSGTNTAAFRVNVGTGGTATTIVLAMAGANTGWNCHAENITATAANRANQRVVQQSSTTTSVTVQNQTISTGAALAFTASDIVAFLCMAY